MRAIVGIELETDRSSVERVCLKKPSRILRSLFSMDNFIFSFEAWNTKRNMQFHLLQLPIQVIRETNAKLSSVDALAEVQEKKIERIWNPSAPICSSVLETGEGENDSNTERCTTILGLI